MVNIVIVKELISVQITLNAKEVKALSRLLDLRDLEDSEFTGEEQAILREINNSLYDVAKDIA